MYQAHSGGGSLYPSADRTSKGLPIAFLSRPAVASTGRSHAQLLEDEGPAQIVVLCMTSAWCAALLSLDDQFLQVMKVGGNMQ